MQDVTIEHNCEPYVWTGYRWYHARDYTVPHEELLRELERALPDHLRAKVRAELALQDQQQRQAVLEAERSRMAQGLRARATNFPRFHDLLREHKSTD